VARLLARLVEQRSAWLDGGDAPPLQELSPLANGAAIALVDSRGDLCWLCHPRPDSPSVFASLIGGDAAGYWRIRPVDGRHVRDQRFLDDSMTLETTWPGVVVTDTLLAPDPRFPATRLVRRVSTSTPVQVEFAPRGDFGRAPVSWTSRADGVTAHCGQTTLDIRAPGVSWRIEEHPGGGTAVATLDPPERIDVDFDLVIDQGTLAHRDLPDPAGARVATEREWSAWADDIESDDPIVRRSALVLRALCYRPTGAVLAAATTSLPEVIGGVRNWDYRFCWPRDAAYVCRALLCLGCVEEAGAFLDWLGERTERLPSAAMLRPLYPLDGDEYVPEAIIATLPGYRGSRPVRVGNLAEHQLQLDMFGPIVELIHALCRSTRSVEPAHLAMTHALVDGIAERWDEPDHGIWEERRNPRHHVHSKAMCWLGVTRGVELLANAGEPVPRSWPGLADEIRDDVVRNGWSRVANSYAAAYGEDDVDASLLLLATCGIFEPTDARVVATVAAVQDALQDGVVVYRYRHDDGLAGREGGFLICTAWLIEALVAIGRRRDAQVLYRRFVALAGPTGTFTEQFDPRNGVSLGNAPQGYTHAGLIHAWSVLHGSRRPPAP
jgi:GH15 family glucan-1,4-alpha-glucosidase